MKVFSSHTRQCHDVFFPAWLLELSYSSSSSASDALGQIQIAVQLLTLWGADFNRIDCEMVGLDYM
jgi:hypothetical protein